MWCQRSQGLCLASSQRVLGCAMVAREREGNQGWWSCKPSSVQHVRPYGHLSRMTVTRHLKRPTRGSNGSGRASPPIWPCSDWGLPSHGCCQPCGGLLPHHFTLTCPFGLAVCFLWPCPSPCGAQALPGSLPYGARTFLNPSCAGRDRLTPPPLWSKDSCSIGLTPNLPRCCGIRGMS